MKRPWKCRMSYALGDAVQWAGVYIPEGWLQNKAIWLLDSLMWCNWCSDRKPCNEVVAKEFYEKFGHLLANDEVK